MGRPDGRSVISFAAFVAAGAAPPGHATADCDARAVCRQHDQLLCAIVSYVLVRQADDRQALERRGALLAAVQDSRASGVKGRGILWPRAIRQFEVSQAVGRLRLCLTAHLPKACT